MFTDNNFEWPSNRKNAYMIFYKKIGLEEIKINPLKEELKNKVIEEDK